MSQPAHNSLEAEANSRPSGSPLLGGQPYSSRQLKSAYSHREIITDKKGPCGMQ